MLHSAARRWSTRITQSYPAWCGSMEGLRWVNTFTKQSRVHCQQTLTLMMPGKVQICTLNFESLYRVLNGFLGGWGGHDFIRIVMIFNFRPFLGLNSIINMVFIMIMCLHSPLHTCRANLTRPALQETNSKYWTLIGWAGLSWSLSANHSQSANPHYPALQQPKWTQICKG